MLKMLMSQNVNSNFNATENVNTKNVNTEHVNTENVNSKFSHA